MDNRTRTYLAFRERAPSHVRVALRDHPDHAHLCLVALTDERTGHAVERVTDFNYLGWTLDLAAKFAVEGLLEGPSDRARRFYRAQTMDMGEEYIG